MWDISLYKFQIFGLKYIFFQYDNSIFGNFLYDTLNGIKSLKPMSICVFFLILHIFEIKIFFIK
jgi:hypothetical protein